MPLWHTLAPCGAGVAHFEKVVNELPADDKTFKAEDAHFLYASLGFPVDLTELMAEERGLVLDREGFAKKMKEEAEISAIAAQQRKLAGGKDLRLGAEQTAHLQQTGVEVRVPCPRGLALCPGHGCP